MPSSLNIFKKSPPLFPQSNWVEGSFFLEERLELVICYWLVEDVDPNIIVEEKEIVVEVNSEAFEILRSRISKQVGLSFLTYKDLSIFLTSKRCLFVLDNAATSILTPAIARSVNILYDPDHDPA